MYAHLQKPATVAKGQQVTTGQQVGNVGETGNASGCHLHFEIWVGAGLVHGRQADRPAADAEVLGLLLLGRRVKPAPERLGASGVGSTGRPCVADRRSLPSDAQLRPRRGASVKTSPLPCSSMSSC